MVNMDEVRKLVPNVSFEDGIDGHEYLGASYCASDGTADPFRATFAFARAAKRRGANIVNGVEVTGMKIQNHKIVEVETTSGNFSSGIVVNAAGPWGSRIGKMAGVDVPIKPFLCQVCITQKMPLGTLGPYLAVHPYIFVNQTAHANLLFTNSHTELQQFPNHDVGYDVVEYLCHCTSRLFRKIDLGNLPLIRTYSGWNEVAPDGCGMIGFAYDPDNFFVDAGYSGHGFCLGPASGIACADLIMKGSTDLPVDEMMFSRFDKKIGK
jgi:sarcosine oxidase subunit beta